MLQLMDQNAGEGLPGAKRAIEAAISNLPLILKSQSYRSRSLQCVVFFERGMS
jgi:hypothetical protein